MNNIRKMVLGVTAMHLLSFLTTALFLHALTARGQSAETPVIEIATPTNNANFIHPADINIEALITGAIPVTNVEFFANDMLIGQATSSPFSMVWSNAPLGTNLLMAVAMDEAGMRGTSAVVSIAINAPPTPAAPPVIASVVPAPGAVVINLTQAEVTFSKEVTNVMGWDLLVNGAPAQNVSGSGSNYVFTFAQPSFGPVQMSWAATHDIRDNDILALPFDDSGPGATWQYTLVNPAPPVIASVVPAPGAIATELTHALVTFSKEVTNVAGVDLLVNGSPAQSVSGTGSNYMFNFAQPSFGPVQMSWAATQAIRDNDILALPFDGGGAGATWQYTLVQQNPPVIASVVPAPDAIVTNLTQVQVTFNKAVTNVVAADLLINGAPAQSVSGGGGNYVFTFAQPAGGLVFFSWAASQAIRDGELFSQPFDGNGPGATWSYKEITRSGGLQLNGVNQYVTFGTATSLGLRTFTLETWFNWTGGGVTGSSGSGGVVAIPLIAKLVGESENSNLDGNYFLGIRPTDRVLAGDFEEGQGATRPGQNHAILGSSSITPNFWHHAALTYNGTNLVLYLDGRLETTLFVGQSPRWDSIQHAALGGSLNSTGQPSGCFAGVLDEPRIWNYGRSAAQIASGKDQQIPAAPGLIGRWALDETAGTTAYDSSATGINGTLVNNPTWTTGYPFGVPPTVSVVAPSDNAQFLNPADITIMASAYDIDDVVAKVEFFQGATKLGETTNSPYQWVWRNVPAGNYTLTAVVTDGTGIAASSSSIRIRVLDTSGSSWIAFNDHVPGTGTSSYASTWNCFGDSPGASGSLKDIRTGATLPVTLAITRSGSAAAGATAAYPAAGTPAYLAFNGYVDFAGTGNASVQIATNSYVAYTFSGLDPVQRYSFKGSAARGNATYTNRWTLVELIGADSYASAHTANAITAAVAPADLMDNQAALNFGVNLTGDMADWESISPGVDGSFSVVCRQYFGYVPAGSSTDGNPPYGYGIVAMRLEEFGNQPAAAIATPYDGAVFDGPIDLPIQARAMSPAGLSNLFIYANDSLLGEATSNLLDVVWVNATWGSNQIYAVAVDSLGNSATSSVIRVVVIAPPTNASAPFVASQQPPVGFVNNVLTSVRVFFSEAVTGVDAQDLLINGAPASGVTGLGSNYLFSFVQPPFGPVTISWAVNHGITDSGYPSLPFNENGAGAQWSYELRDTIAPILLSRLPEAAAAISNFTQMEVTFSETVTHVDAGDLLINGVPATGISGGGTSYVFTFAQPALGLIHISWDASHGITDPGGNLFDGSAPGAIWFYRLINPSAPYVLTQVPAAAWATNTLTEIQIIFNKPVINVVAEDLLVNGLPATNVTGADAIYVFRFPQPDYGTVTIRWTNTQGIIDLETPPNLFDATLPEAAWQYQLVNEQPPTIAAVTPAPDASVTNLTQALITFSENVSGVDASDLLINGVPAQSRSGGGSNYLFHFAQPAYGPVTLGWAAQHGIANVGILFLAFDASQAGANWAYQLMDATPPTVIARTPAAGASVSNLFEIAVTFSEAVQHVKANDLLINGTPAHSLQVQGNSCTFYFQQPAYGRVDVAWAVNHGITDLSSNLFDGSGAGAVWSCTLVPPRATLVASNAWYQWRPGANEASTPVTAWRQPGFDASAWNLGQGPFYYDDDRTPVPYNGNTLIVGMRSMHTTVYLRHEFTRTNAARFTNLTLRYRLDDGMVLWLNGTEIHRSALVRAGELPYTTTTTSSVIEPLSDIYYPLANSPLVVEGTNVLAVLGINATLASSDFLLDLDLTADDQAPLTTGPQIVFLNPPSGVIYALPSVTVVFSTPLVNLEAGDFLVNGVPATKVTEAGAMYTFEFPAPAFGPVQISWATNHEIVGLSGRPFDITAPSATRSYRLVNVNAPVMLARQPAPNATVISLTNLVVRFDKPVANVDAADLLINGIPATGMSGSGSDYEFTFPAPAYGNVQASWAAAHGIVDADDSGNVFDATDPSASWQFTWLYQAPPMVAVVTPAPGLVTNLTTITVRFSEAVKGVDASDLLVNGIAASAASGSGSNYIFQIPQQPVGVVAVSWASNHRITDVETPSLPFDETQPGATWLYVVSDVTPPQLVARIPAAGSALSNLTGIQVVFSEAVSNIQPQDLLINGLPASGLTGSGSNYNFAFPQPPHGFVTVEWAGSQRIVDLWGNSFDAAASGASWRYELFNANAPTIARRVPAAATDLVTPTAERVFVISVDGLRADLLQSYMVSAPQRFPSFVRLQTEGAFTFNARPDYDITVTTPNHCSMVTGLPVLQQPGWAPELHHGVTDNSTTTLIIHQWSTAGTYIPSVFDVVHDHGLSVACYVSKQKLSIFERSYGPIWGAPDLVGEDNGRNKIDTALTVDGTSAPLISSLLTAPPRHFTFMHFTEPDSTGHGSGWGSPAWSNAVATVDTFLAKVLDLVATNEAYRGRTAIIVTADHGGSGTDHSQASLPADYTIPYFVWGAGLPAGADLYNFFTNRFNPGAGRPSYSDAQQPIRNGDSGNLALNLLRLPSIPNSVMKPQFLPASGAVTELTSIEVGFSEPVANVQAGDLLVNGIPATNLLMQGSNYVFQFPQPHSGMVQVSWASGQGIVDLEDPANAFEAWRPSANWQIELIFQEPPVLAGISPAAGTTVTNLSAIQVVFSEDVAGVNADDLLVNGAPAGGISGSGNNYTFTFPQPLAGLVLVTWSATHGIQDAGSPPKPFDSSNPDATWSYTLLDLTPPPQPPSAPVQLLAGALGTNRIQLSWIDTATNETGFRLERSLDGETFSLLAEIGADSTSVIDDNLLPGTAFFYRVRAFNNVGHSDFSSVAGATTVFQPHPPAAPMQLIASADNGKAFYRSQIFLNWRDRSTNESGFLLERSQDGETFQPLTTLPANHPYYVDRGLNSATMYFYRVKAINSTGESEASNIASEQTHPQSQVTLSGQGAVFHAGAEGASPIHYQWRFDGLDLLGETNETLTIHNVRPKDDGAYSVFITDANGSVESNPAWLYVLFAPEILAQPASVTNSPGSTVTFRVEANGTDPVFFQWRHAGTNLPGATDAELTLNHVGLADVGGYDVIVENDYGVVASEIVQLVLNRPPVLSAITNHAIDEWTTLSFGAEATDVDMPSQALTYSLAPSAPYGASIDPVSGVFTWRPNELQGGGSYDISIIVTDDGLPAMSATQSFTVHVQNTQPDFIVAAGSTNLLLGENNVIPISLVSGADLWIVMFNLEINQERLTNLVLHAVSPEVDHMQFRATGPNQFIVSFVLDPAKRALSDRVLASLALQTAGPDSAIVPVRISGPIALLEDGSVLTEGSAHSGQVVILTEHPILLMHRNASLGLVLYGKPGTKYQVESAVNPITGSWKPVTNVLMDGASTIIGVDPTQQQVFYRARKL